MGPVRTSATNRTFNTFAAMVLGGFLALLVTIPAAAAATDAEIVAALDTKYQAAVERNDAETMDAILADDFVLVLGNGTVFGQASLALPNEK